MKLPDSTNKHPSIGGSSNPGTYVDGLTNPGPGATWPDLAVSGLSKVSGVAQGFKPRLIDDFAKMLMGMAEGLVERDCLPYMFDDDIAAIAALKTINKTQFPDLFPSLSWSLLMSDHREDLLDMLNERGWKNNFWELLVKNILRRFFYESTVTRYTTVTNPDEYASGGSGYMSWNDSVTIGPFQFEPLTFSGSRTLGPFKGNRSNWTFFPSPRVESSAKVVEGLWGTADTNFSTETGKTSMFCSTPNASGEMNEHCRVIQEFENIAPQGMTIFADHGTGVTREDMYWGLRGNGTARTDSMLWNIYSGDSHRNPWTRASGSDQFASYYSGSGPTWVTPRRSQDALGLLQVMLGSMAANSARFPWHVRSNHYQWRYSEKIEVFYDGSQWCVMHLPDAQPSESYAMKDDIQLRRYREYTEPLPTPEAYAFFEIRTNEYPVAEGGANELLKSDADCVGIWGQAWYDNLPHVDESRQLKGYAYAHESVSWTCGSSSDPMVFLQKLGYDDVEDIPDDTEVYVQEKWPAKSWAAGIGTPASVHVLRYNDQMPLYNVDGETETRIVDWNDPLTFTMYWQQYDQNDGWHKGLKTTIDAQTPPDPSLTTAYLSSFDTTPLEEWGDDVEVGADDDNWYAVYDRSNSPTVVINGNTYYLPSELRQIVSGSIVKRASWTMVGVGYHYSIPATAAATGDDPESCFSAASFSEVYDITHGDNIGSVAWQYRTVTGRMA